MDISEVKERKRQLESLIAQEIMKFERDTGVSVNYVDLPKITSIDPHYVGPGYVSIRTEI